MGLGDQMKLSINTRLINKNESGDKSAFSHGFLNHDLSALELAEQINKGFAFSFQFRPSVRQIRNFLCSDVIAADIDEGMTLDEAASNDLIQNFGTILYTTASHTDEEHRFRVIFELPRTVTDSEELRFALRGLARSLDSDYAATDPARISYGSRGSNPQIIGHRLTSEKLDELIELGKTPHNLTDTADKSGYTTSRSSLFLAADMEVIDRQGHSHSIHAVPPRTSIYCPFHTDKNPSAFTVESRSGSKGIHCSSCQQTFWVKEREPSPYDFFEFDRLAEEAHKTFVPGEIVSESSLPGFEEINPHHDLNERFLPSMGLELGRTLVKSPKGTGKTEYLNNVIRDANKRGWSVLLIGHRRTLIHASADRLGLECYLDREPSKKKNPRMFAISVDSIVKLSTKQDKYDVVLIDESEQVFSHLIADTMDIARKRLAYMFVQHFIRAAKSVVALDADLNRITLRALQTFGSHNPLGDTHYTLNQHKSTSGQICLYKSKNHLIGELRDSVRTNERCFVCSNSKKVVEELTLALQMEFGEALKILSITSANSGDDKIVEFIKNIQTRITDYQVVIVSPAISSGIDITIPDDLPGIDSVYGLFESRVNTHFDIDQQLSRVRSPKNSPRVWISPETFQFETEIDPIKIDLAESGLIPGVLTGIEKSGDPIYDFDDPYLNLYAEILASQRASKNQLASNFRLLREYNGWTIVEVESDDEVKTHGSRISKEGRAARETLRIQSILNAEEMDEEAADVLNDRSKSKVSLTSAEQFALARYNIKQFYRLPISEELIARDNEGRLQQQIILLESVVSESKRDVQSIKAASSSSATGEQKPYNKKHERVATLVEILQSSGVLSQDNEFNTSLTLTVERLQTFSKHCIDNKASIERVLELDVRSNCASNPTQQLNRFLSLIGLKVSKVGSISHRDGKKTYEYRLDKGEFNEMIGFITHRSPNR